MLLLWTASESEYLRRVVSPAVRSIPRPRPSAKGCEWSPYDLKVPERGQVMMAMGSKPVGQLQQFGIVPKNLSINKLRGRLWEAGDDKGHWMVTYDPYLVERDPQAELDIQWDVRLAMRYLMTGTLRPRIGKYRWVDDFSGTVEAIERIHAETGRPVKVTEDLETLGLWPWYDHAWIVSISFTVEVGTADVMAFPSLGDEPSAELLEQVRWVENSDKVSLCGANLKFDNVWKRAKWGLPSPSSFRFDTLLGGGLLNENVRNSLNMQAKVHTDMGGYDDLFNERHDKARMDLALAKDPEEYLVYAGGDTDACARVRGPIAERLREDPGLIDFYTHILHPAARAFEAIEYRGILVDESKLREVGIRCAQEEAECLATMNDLVPGRLKMKHAERFKYTPAVLREIFFGDSGWGLPVKALTEKAPKVDRNETPGQFMARLGPDGIRYASTSVDEHLKMFREHPEAGPFVKALQTKNKAEKIRTSYVDGFLKHLRPDGRIHPTYGLYVGSLYEWAKAGKDDEAGANTGRTSAKNPHVQTIPKRGRWAKELRGCYPAPEGFRWFNADVDQGELKISACLADEPTMIQAYRDGQDLHLKTGANLAGLSYEDGQALEESDPDRFENVRYGAKAVNFGKIYGQSPPGFVDYAYKQWDLVYTLEESERIHRDFFALYNRLPRWHSDYIHLAKRQKFVRNPLGRIRHLPTINSRDRKVASKAGRQAINSPVQSCLNDLCLWAIALAEFEYRICGPELLQPVLFTHDSISGYYPVGGEELVLKLVWIMENLPIEDVFEWQPQLHFSASAEAGGETLASMSKLKADPIRP